MVVVGCEAAYIATDLPLLLSGCTCPQPGSRDAVLALPAVLGDLLPEHAVTDTDKRLCLQAAVLLSQDGGCDLRLPAAALLGLSHQVGKGEVGRR